MLKKEAGPGDDIGCLTPLVYVIILWLLSLKGSRPGGRGGSVWRVSIWDECHGRFKYCHEWINCDYIVIIVHYLLYQERCTTGTARSAQQATRRSGPASLTQPTNHNKYWSLYDWDDGYVELQNRPTNRNRSFFRMMGTCWDTITHQAYEPQQVLDLIMMWCVNDQRHIMENLNPGGFDCRLHVYRRLWLQQGWLEILIDS